MDTTKQFQVHGVQVEVDVFAEDSQGNQTRATISQEGILDIPKAAKSVGFYLAVRMPTGARLVIAQKNVGEHQGGYHQIALTDFGGSIDGWTTWTMDKPIEVQRSGENVWTSWHVQRPNRIDCWFLSRSGALDLFQIGVITHDDGQTFRLLGEYRWRGKLYEGSVACPRSPEWGPILDSRKDIFNNPDFVALIETATLDPWDGDPEQLEPSLEPAPAGQHARVQWYVPFAGQKGQGIAILYDGTPAWIHGNDLDKPVDADGIKRVRTGDLIAYTGKNINWGAKKKKDSPPRLIGVSIAAI